MTRASKRWRAGFSLIEAIIFTMVAGSAGLLVAKLGVKTTSLNQALKASDLQRQMYRVADQIALDLTEADPGTIVWSSLPPNSVTTTTIQQCPSFRIISLDSVGATTQSLSVRYYYQSAGSGVGNLVREQNDGTTTKTKILATNVLTPTTANPLFEQDSTAYHMVNIRLMYKTPTQSSPAILVRRVGIRG